MQTDPCEYTAAMAARSLPLPEPDANKYSRGQVLVCAGSCSFPGAAVLASLAAVRSGAGYATLLTPAPAAEAARAHLVSVPVVACSSTGGCFDGDAVEELCARAPRARALLAGPGMGREPQCLRFAEQLCSHPALFQLPLLLDADALFALAHEPSMLDARCAARAVTVLTPHEGEAARLLGRAVARREDDALELARRYCAVVVLKGPQTLVAAPSGELFVCRNAGPELAKAGSGDVLAGMIAAFLAQGLQGVDSACLGVYLHGRSGALAAGELGVLSVLPEDLIDKIGPAVCSLEGHSDSLAAARGNALERAGAR